jgi:hypothetical protein
MSKQKKRGTEARKVSCGQGLPTRSRPSAAVSPATSARKATTPDKNADLINSAMEIQESIRGAYRLDEEHRPVMLYHVQEERIYAYPYLEYKGTLSERSQALLENQYKDAQRNDQIVVFVRDDETKRLISLSIDYE